MHRKPSISERSSGLDYIPFPWIQYVCLAVVLWVNEFPITFIAPILPFLVIDLGLAKATQDVGLHVGLIASMYYLGRALSSRWWGTVGDLYGRKVVVYVSLLSSVIFTLTFGWTQSYLGG